MHGFTQINKIMFNIALLIMWEQINFYSSFHFSSEIFVINDILHKFCQLVHVRYPESLNQMNILNRAATMKPNKIFFLSFFLNKEHGKIYYNLS